MEPVLLLSEIQIESDSNYNLKVVTEGKGGRY